VNLVTSKLERVEIDITDNAIVLTERSNLGHETRHLVTGEAHARVLAAIGHLMREAHQVAEASLHNVPQRTVEPTS
jgi:hypothetical protein